MEPLQKMGVVFYFVSDWERAKAFYGETLGMKQVYCSDEGGWAEYATNSDVNLAIHRTRPGQEVAQGGGTAIFDVADANDAKTQLEGRGVSFAGELRDIPGITRLGTFLDPDGNKLQIVQDLSKGG